MPDFQEIFHQTLAAIPVNGNAFNMGLSNGWISPTLETLSHPDSVLPLTTAQSSTIASSQDMGRIAGAILAVLLLDTIGRRKSLIIVSVVFFLQWILIWLTRSVWIICVLRLLYGAANGFQDVTSSIYLGENISPKMRGVFGSIMILFFYLGILVEFSIVNFFSYYDVAVINSVIGGVSLLTNILLKEPAQYLIMKGELDKAKKTFMWLRNAKESDQQVMEEFASIRENIFKERDRKKSLINLLSTRFIYKIISIVCVLYTLTSAAGFSAVSSYATVSFSSGFFSKKELTVLLGAMQLIAVLLSSLFIERFPRKTIMTTLFGLASLVNLCSSSLFFTQQYICQIANFSWYIFGSISGFSVVYAMGIIPCVSLMRGELFPQSVKVIGGCICIVGHALSGICVNFSYLRVAERYGMFANYLLFSIWCFIILLFVHFMVPETRGKSLVEIQRCIDKKSFECNDESGGELEKTSW